MAEPTSEKSSISRYAPLPIVLSAVAAGIAFDRFCPLTVCVWLLAASAAWIAWLLVFRRGGNKPAVVLILLGAACAAGGWHHFRWSHFVENDIAFFAAAQGRPDQHTQPVCLRAVVTGGPRRMPAPPYDPMQIIPRIDRTRLELRVTSLRDGGTSDNNIWRPAGGRATLFVSGHVLGILAGDRVEVFASMRRSGPPRNPGEFDYATHLRADGKLATLWASRPQCVRLLGPTTSSGQTQVTLGAWQLLDRVRAAGHRVLWRYLDERTRGLAAALLLGSRDQLDRQQYDTFAQTGTIHLLAVSGLHVGILAGAVLLVVRLFRIPRGRGLLVVAVATIAYTLLTDARPPAVRATVLVLMMCLAYALARRPSPYNSLAAAALLVLAINPAELFRVGAQLSFLAVATIMFFWPLIRRSEESDDQLDRLIRKTEPPLMKAFRWACRWYWRATLVSLVIWLVVAPLVMARFHILSPGSVILTPILLPLVAVALGSGLIVLACGWLLPPLAIVAAFACNYSLLFIQKLVNVAHIVPGSHVWVAGPADWWLGGFYGGLGLLLAFPRLRPGRRGFVALLVGWMAVGLAVSLVDRNEGQLACTFLSVGHGCATVVELPDGRTILYDTGQFTSPAACARTVAGCLWSRGITHLDAVVISHADADHYNGLPQLIEKFSIGAVYVSPQMFDDPGSSVRALEESIRAAGIPIRYLQAGDRLDLELRLDGLDKDGHNDEGRCRIDVLHPGPSDTDPKGNDNAKFKTHDNSKSIVLLLSYQGRRILLPGDIEPPGLDKLLAQEPIDCDVLLVPHHGSSNSDPPGLAAWCKPEVAIVSGTLARYPSQTETAYKASRQVFHTGRVGAVHVEIENGRIRASGFLEVEDFSRKTE